MANVALRKEDGKVFVKGELSFESVAGLLGEDLFTGQQKLVINLSEVTHSDSAGLALLINWYREAKKNSVTIEFEGVPQKMAALAKVSSLDKILPIV